MFQRRKPQEFTYVDTPKGLFTSTAQWYGVTEKELKAYAEPLWDHLSITELLKQTEIWIKSADSLSIFLLLVLVWFAGGAIGLVGALAFFYFWHTSKSAFASPSMSGLMNTLNNEFITFLSGVIVLSLLGMDGRYLDLSFAGSLFLLFRFGWLRTALDKYLKEKPNFVPLNDRLLNVLLLKNAIKFGVELPRLKRWETQILDAANRKKA